MDITAVLTAIITLIAAAVSTFLIPWLKQRFNAEQLNTLQQWVRTAVAAAEMLYEGSNRGAEKKCYVLGFLQERGFAVNEKQIDAVIEAAVFEVKKGITD